MGNITRNPILQKNACAIISFSYAISGIEICPEVADGPWPDSGMLAVLFDPEVVPFMGLDDNGLVRSRVSVPERICCTSCASTASDPGLVVPNAQMMFCICSESAWEFI